MSETVIPSNPDGSLNGSNRVPHQRGGEGFSAPVWPTEVLDRAGAPVVVPEVTSQVIDVEPVVTPPTETVSRLGRLASKLEAATQPVSPESGEASRKRVSAWMERGQARREAGRQQWAARFDAMKQKFGEVKEVTKQTFTDVARIGRVALPVAYGMIGEGIDAAKRGIGDAVDATRTAARNTAHTAAAYSHEVRANVADVKMGAVSPREKLAGWRVDRSQGKLDKNQKKLDVRRAAATQHAYEAAKLGREGKYARAFKENVKAKVRNRVAEFSQGRVTKHQADLDRRMVPLQKWETRVADYDLQAALHRDAAQVRRKLRTSR